MQSQRFVVFAIVLAAFLSLKPSLKALTPGQSFDLSHWKLTLPVDNQGGIIGQAAEIRNPLLQDYSSEFFYIGADGAMIFWCPVLGATTGSADAPRTELRELLNGSDSTVNWAAYGTHTLKAQCQVTQQPDSGAVIIGQVHGYPTQRLVKVEYDQGQVQVSIRKKPSSDGDTQFSYTVGSQAPINYQIQVVDGVALVTVNGVTKSHNFFADDPVWKNMTYYFKAGAYLQDNLGPPTEGGRVSFYQISATHLILPPTISAPPISQTVSPGAALTLTATATGTFPLFYQWRADGVAPAAWTNASLLLTNFQAGDQRNYEVIVSNAAGAVTSAPAALYLNTPLRFRNPRNTGGRFTALLLGAANSNYVLQTSSNLIAWTSVATNNSLSGIITLNRTNPPGRTRYYRARLK